LADGELMIYHFTRLIHDIVFATG